MFVVIALRSEGSSQRSVERFEAFATPTLVAFSTVLVLSALLTVPRHSEASMSASLLLSGIAGIVYTIYNTQQVQRENGYEYASDWAWRHAGPGLDYYVALVIAGVVVWLDDAAALNIAGASAAVMLFIGIHNAWDTAVWIAVEHPDDEHGA